MGDPMNRLAYVVTLLVIGLVLCAGSAKAQTVEELKQELAAKDAEIARLRGRVRQLESGGAMPVRAADAQPTYLPPPPPGSPGGDDDMDRALEQALVSQGALVLSPFSYELAPEFSWAHWDSVTNPTLENSYSAGLNFRMGLPWRSQISIGVPYVWSDFGESGSADGLGDAGVVFSKELLQEGPIIPALLGSVGWTSPTSRACCTGPIPYVSGFQGGLTAVKRLDPLVAFASVSYYSEISGFVVGSAFNPSDVIGTRLGASLAVTPTTSLTAGLNISFLTDTPSLPGPQPDDVLASVDLGFNTLLWRRTFISTTAQFGLTGDIPDFRLITTVPVRF
jgi:hypothetical protein